MDCRAILSQIKESYSYSGYRKKVKRLSDINSHSGKGNYPDGREYARFNSFCMDRIEKKFKLSNELQTTLENLPCQFTWVVLVDSWSCDTAQNLPVIAKISECTPNIDLKIKFIDDDPKIMDEYLTTCGWAIPELICFNKTTGTEVGTWGPRPTKIMYMIEDYNRENVQFNHEKFLCNLHLWYARDRGNAVQQDLTDLLQEWTGKIQNPERYDLSCEDDYCYWDLDVLVDHIIFTYHKQARTNVFQIEKSLKESISLYGQDYPQLKQIYYRFNQVINELVTHMNNEEVVLFSYIKQLQKSKKERVKFKNPWFETIRRPIHLMEKEHQMADTIFDRIKKLANNYRVPAGASDSCKVIYQKLKDFEDCLRGCIYLENNVLFPKAIKIEEELLNNEKRKN